MKSPFQSRKSWVVAGLLLLAASSCGVLVFGQRGLLELRRLRGESAALERSNQELQGRNRGLERRMGALKDDPTTIERLARERLGMVKEGEVVYYLSREGAQGGSLGGSTSGPTPAPPRQAQPPDKPAPQGTQPAPEPVPEPVSRKAPEPAPRGAR